MIEFYEIMLVLGTMIVTFVISGVLFHFFKNPFDL